MDAEYRLVGGLARRVDKLHFHGNTAGKPAG